MTELKQVTAKKTVKINKDAFGKCDYTSITWLASAGFLINSRGTIILIDPVIMTKEQMENISEIGLELKIPYPIKAIEVPKVDIVLYTHSDADHMGPETALVLDKLTPQFIGPHPVFRQLVMLGIDPLKAEICRTGDVINISNITIEVTPADHPWQLQYPERGIKPFRMGDCCGFIVTTPDARIFFPGDTRLMEEHVAVKDIDVLVVDASLDSFHLGHHGAIILSNAMQDALLIPMHYGTYNVPGKPAHTGDPEDIFSQVKNSDKRVRILAPGQPLVLKNKVELLNNL